MPSVLEHALKCLTQVDADSRASEPETPLIAIRQLLKALPEHVPGASADIGDDVQTPVDNFSLGRPRLGPSQTQSAMGLALSRIPGSRTTNCPLRSARSANNMAPHRHRIQRTRLAAVLPDRQPRHHRRSRLATARAACARRRSTSACGSSCNWVTRYSARCGRCTARPQSCSACNRPPPQRWNCLATFNIHRRPSCADRTHDDTSLSQHRQNLSDQFNDANLSSKDAAELLWQAKLAGHSSDYLEQLIAAIGQLDRQTLLTAAQRLINAEGGWLCLATDSAPGAPWQATN